MSQERDTAPDKAESDRPGGRTVARDDAPVVASDDDVAAADVAVELVAIEVVTPELSLEVVSLEISARAATSEASRPAATGEGSRPPIRLGASTLPDGDIRATSPDQPGLGPLLRGRRVQPSRGVIAGLSIGLMGAALIAPLELLALATDDMEVVWVWLSLVLGLGVTIGCTLGLSEWLVARLRPRPLRAACWW